MRLLLVVAIFLAGAPVAEARTDRLDRSFGGGRGSIRVFVGEGSSQAWQAIRTRNGKLLMAGTAWVAGAGRHGLALARLHPSGRPDHRFGRRGRTIIGGGRLGGPRALAELPDGRLLLAVTRAPPSYGPMRLAVVRIGADGRWDRGFGTAGVAEVELPESPGDDRDAVAMAVSRGRPVLAGTTSVDGHARVALARFTTEGQLDPSFGEDGISLPDLGEPATAGSESLVRLSAGRLLLAARRGRLPGMGYALDHGTIMARIAEDGAVEPGWRIEAARVEPYDLVVEPGGGIAALVYRFQATGSGRWGVLRWRADGTLRPGFEARRRRPPFSASELYPFAGFARDRRGRFYVPGDHGMMARVRRSGGRDGSWARRGLTNRLGTRLELGAADVVLLARGRVVSVGYAAEGSDSREDFGRSSMWVAAFR